MFCWVLYFIYIIPNPNNGQQTWSSAAFHEVACRFFFFYKEHATYFLFSFDWETPSGRYFALLI